VAGIQAERAGRIILRRPFADGAAHHHFLPARTYCDGGEVKNETVANISALPDHVIDLIDAGLKGQQLVPATGAAAITRSLPHGHVAAVHAMAAKLSLRALMGPPGRHRDLALALIISRLVKPASKLSP
jgi:hypothetical protein